jgi:hypothetical protein
VDGIDAGPPAPDPGPQDIAPTTHVSRCIRGHGDEGPSGFPFDPERGPGFIRDTIAATERMRASDLDKAKIYEGNARRLLRLKPA